MIPCLFWFILIVREQGTGKGEKKLLVGSTDLGLYQSNIPRLAAGLPRVSRETFSVNHPLLYTLPLLRRKGRAGRLKRRILSKKADLRALTVLL